MYIHREEYKHLLFSPIEEATVSCLTKTHHLSALTEAVYDARVKWKDIGRALRVPLDVLNEIERDLYHRNDGQRMERVLVEWLHTGKGTIHQLLRALKDKSVRRHDISMVICSRVGKDRTAVGLCEISCSICNPSQ